MTVSKWPDLVQKGGLDGSGKHEKKQFQNKFGKVFEYSQNLTFYNTCDFFCDSGHQKDIKKKVQKVHVNVIEKSCKSQQQKKKLCRCWSKAVVRNTSKRVPKNFLGTSPDLFS